MRERDFAFLFIGTGLGLCLSAIEVFLILHNMFILSVISPSGLIVVAPLLPIGIGLVLLVRKGKV